MIPVTVIITTKNEGARIESCLNALRDFAECIVVDSNSADDTALLARSCGASVINFNWNGHYPKKRQWCLDHLKTRYDWILFIDADEILTPALAQEIATLFPQPGCAGYFIRGLYIWDKTVLRHGLKNNKLVLFNRHYFKFPVVDDLDLPMGEIEGHYQPVLKSSGYKIGQLQCAMIHDAAQSPTEWAERHERYAVWERAMNARNAWPADPVRWRQTLKKLFRKAPARGTIAFLHSYIVKRGFLDGRAGYDFAQARAAYYRLITRA